MSQASLSPSHAANPPAALDPEQEATLRAVVTESFGDLFTAYGFTVRLLDLTHPLASRSHDVVGFIGFAGDVRGSLVLSGPKQLFRRTSPLAGEAGDLPEPALFDWTAELANQLLGRIKRRFCMLGRDFHASTPTAIAGRELSRRFSPRTGVVDLVFGVGGDLLCLCFEITPPPNGKIFLSGAEAIQVSNEGDTLLF
ncbi:MAG TPA: chemotaxis protein CheX [Polyangia bacterium]